ncbi:AAA family ATPase [Metallosphaera javensis (ex Sakai et al. 2022)]|uniref:AAA family ATPase n=1 Tax=Metallosphaera javensis (ex Sakai et al. 2022) TaxID=2775498 RepID=UPI002590E8A1|nr:MAG: hypothetical protein MjAS7_2952 [Metallosphaera javensis (ex Sakai et al. 2022)]
MESLNADLTVKRVAVNRIRGFEFIDEDGKTLVLSPGKINVITGPNGSLKTSFLEALSAGLLGVTSEFQSKLKLATTLRMEELWLYYLVNGDLDLEIDGMKVRSATLDEIRQFAPLPNENQVNPEYTRGIIAEVGNYRSMLRFDIPYVQSTTNLSSVIISFSRNNSVPPRNVDFVSFSLPNPITPQFVYDFLKIIKNPVEDIVEKINSEGFKFVGFFPDELGRNSIVFEGKKGRMNIQLLGSGYSAYILLALSTSHDVILYDNVENHLHLKLMFKVMDLMRDSRSQWFVTTQSLEFIRFLSSSPHDVKLWRFRKAEDGKVMVKTYTGEEIREAVKVLKVDLRG